MSQRNSGYARKERDLYETPEWVTDALVPHLPRGRGGTLWEPACGSGKMVRALHHGGYTVYSSDIHTLNDYTIEADFLDESWRLGHDWDGIVTNPPYEAAQQFIEVALRRSEPVDGFVAMLLRTDYDHAKSRRHLFADNPAFAKKLVLTKRIVWFEGGKSPSFNHAWFIWDWKCEDAPTITYGP